MAVFTDARWLAAGLVPLMGAMGLRIPSTAPVLDATPVAAGLAAGLVVTLLAGLGPAVRASRVPPVAALRGRRHRRRHRPDRRRCLRQRAGELVRPAARRRPGDLRRGHGRLSTDLAPAVAALPEVAVAWPVGIAPVRIDGDDAIVTTLDPATIESLVDLGMRQGSVLRADQVAVSAGYAGDHHLTLGDPVTVGFGDGATERPRVGST